MTIYPLRFRHWRLRVVTSAILLMAAVGAGMVGKPTSASGASPPVGAAYNAAGDKITFRVFSKNAKRIEVYLYKAPRDEDEVKAVTLTEDAATHIWSTTVSVPDLTALGVGTVYYGYRAWGPNWPFVSTWTKGSLDGFKSDVDDQGNRFNPNKLLLDPYAREVIHDPRNAATPTNDPYTSGQDNRGRNTGRIAPKGIVLRPVDTAGDFGVKPKRPFLEEVIYEVHLRGLTRGDDAMMPESDRGTYRGAARKAAYLKDLGVTAVEFLPVQEFCNDQNDSLPAGAKVADYWGYETVNYFSPDRRYAADRTPGGPTREFKAMVKAFHDQGLKVYLDVVYNHAGEGGLGHETDPTQATIFSQRGLDNATYYEFATDGRLYYDGNGHGSGGNNDVGPNLNVTRPAVRALILDSLHYWADELGVDSFRFDLAPILANRIDRNGFAFDPRDPDNVLNRAARELPVRPASDDGAGIDLIAEPWHAKGPDGQQQGNFPAGWAEWNDRFRDRFRESQNKLGFAKVTPGELATRFARSRDLYQDDGRKPWHSINSLVEHDGPCLRDLYAFNNDGRRAWNQNGDVTLQRQAARNGFLLPMVSAGTPMFTGGDEMYRTVGGNDNPFNLDSAANWLNWSDRTNHPKFTAFASGALRFRRDHRALRRCEYFQGADQNHNGLKDITWYKDDGAEPDAAYFDDGSKHFLAYRIDGTEVGDPAASIYVAYNWWQGDVNVHLPANLADRHWLRVADTAAWMEDQSNIRDSGHEDPLAGGEYVMHGRSMLLLIEL